MNARSSSCPECKTELAEFAQACPVCGFPIAQFRANVARRRRRTVIGVVALVVLCAGFCIVFVSTIGYYASKENYRDAVLESEEWARKNTATRYCMACEMDAWEKKDRSEERIGTYRALIPLGACTAVVGLFAWVVNRRIAVSSRR